MPQTLHAAALEMCQLTLSAREDGAPPLTQAEIAAEVDEILAMRRFSGLIDREPLIKELEEIFTIWSNAPTALDSGDNHIPWLSQARAEINPQFWNRYKLYLLRKQRMGPIAIENIERVSDEVLSRLENPKREGSWDRRGLVMGDVQSGKTGTYVGLICKAADAGYKVIIVLAGLHNNLRSQTQIRLDEGFLGYKAVPPLNGGAGFEPTGVAEFGTGPRADSVTNRNENGDFNRQVAQHFGIHPGGNPLLFVVKKNVSVLKHLLGWIHSSADSTDPETGRKFHRHIPVLVIDDEADQGSVDTNTLAVDEDGNPDEDHDPTKTNKLIRSLLFSFERSAYVGFTATPFANIFIHERARTNDLGDDLFPRSFIINLPAPSNYTGAARIFGISNDEDAGLQAREAAPIVRLIRDHAASDRTDEDQGWMPPKLVDRVGHLPLWQGRRNVPPSLREAMLSFLLSASVRAIREPKPQFNSMLIHVVRFTNVQMEVKEQVTLELRDIVARLTLGDGARTPSMLDEMRDLWERDFLPTTDGFEGKHRLPQWAVVAEVLPQVALSIEVKAINGSAADALDYEAHKESGLNVIAIGGDKLSRGLTLEGLTTSYFLRSSRMYDTLMQMGRWFGYREKYLDICRLYMTRELQTWFRHIASATEELRLEFEHMVAVGGSPRDYGLKVRAHPAMLITSALKMRTGTEMQLSYAGVISETIIFETGNRAVVERNVAALQSFVGRLTAERSGGPAGGYAWKAVDAAEVLDFLSAYRSHPDARRVDTRLLAHYIRKQREQGELTSWFVKVVSVASSKRSFANILEGCELGSVYRARYPADQEPGRFTIRRLVSPTDEVSDLSTEEKTLALERTRELWEKNTKKNKSTEQPTAASGPGIRAARPKERGLLLVYPIDPQEALGESEVPIIGIAVSFPNSETARTISYTVNNIFTQLNDYDEL